MRIIIHDAETSLLSLFAAQLYLNFDKKRNFEEIKKLVLINLHKILKPIGKLIYVGKDKFGNEVYVVGRKKHKKIFCQAVMGFSKILDSNKKIIFYDLSSYHNRYLKFSTFLKLLDFSPSFISKIAFYGIFKEFKSLTSDIEKFHYKIKEIT